MRSRSSNETVEDETSDSSKPRLDVRQVESLGMRTLVDACWRAYLASAVGVTIRPRNYGYISDRRSLPCGTLLVCQLQGIDVHVIKYCGCVVSVQADDVPSSCRYGAGCVVARNRHRVRTARRERCVQIGL